MTTDEDDDAPLEQLAAGAVTTVTLLVAFGLMFAGVPFFWVAFPVGFGGLLPLSIGLVRWHEQKAEREADPGPDRTDAEDALADLRLRYVRGELTEAEFERRVANLFETESVHEARKYAERPRESDRTSASNADEREPTSDANERGSASDASDRGQPSGADEREPEYT